MAMAIENLANWSPAKKVETRNGPRMLRTARPSENFWSAWRSDKDALREAGLSVSKNREGNWEACWWTTLDAQEQQKVDDAQHASRATDSDASLLCPEGLAYLGYQKAGIAYALSRQNVLIGDEMGLGKTIQAVGIFNNDPSIKSVLIVCPASLRLNWRREFEKWATRPVRVAVVNGGKPSDFPRGGSYDVLVVNYDVLGKHRSRIDAIQFDLLISDECHYLKNPKAIRTKSVLGSKTKGVQKDKPISARRRVFLTGTPIVNRPVELWPLVEALDSSDMGRNFFAFAKRYCNAKQTRWGWDFSGASNLPELQRKLREKFMVRRLKSEVLTELPAKRRQVVEIPANGASEAVRNERQIFDSHQQYIAELEERLHQMEVESAYEIGDHSDEAIASVRKQLSQAKSVAFAEMSKVRHEVALAKVPYVVAHLQDALEEGPVVCFAHHRDVIAKILESFPGAVSITGDTSMEARQAAVDSFQAGNVNLFVGNIQAAGVGITLTKSAHVVFAELDWVPGNLSQAEDRCHRIGQQDSVLVQHLVLEDSVDAIMAKKIVAKQEVIDEALDRQVEVDFGSKRADSVEIEIKPYRIQEEAVTINPEAIAAIHAGLKILASRCDGARELDGAGFSKFDARFGHSLAAMGSLSSRQAVLGRKLVNKYRRQLSQDLLKIALN